MSVSTAETIRSQLDSFGFKGYISISGMGEPFLNQDILEICKTFSQYKIRILTNGLTKRNDYGQFPSNAQIVVSIHSVKNESKIKKILSQAKNVVYRCHDPKSDSCELITTNRGGYIKKDATPGICTFPFYKTLIDVDGHYLLCADDWTRTSYGELSIFNTTLSDYFTKILKPIKDELIKNGRSFSPCRECSANGKLMGMEKVEWYKNNVSTKKSLRNIEKQQSHN